MAALEIEYGEYAVADARTYVTERTTTDDQTAMLDRLFVRWEAHRANYGIGYLPAFIAWLGTLGFELTGYLAGDTVWSGHTTNCGDTLLNDDFGWTYVHIGDHGPFVAIEWDNGLGVHCTPTFYRDKGEECFFDWSRGRLWCASTDRHAFDTEDAVWWTPVTNEKTPSGPRFKLYDLPRHIDRDGEESGYPACPTCGDPIQTGATY